MVHQVRRRLVHAPRVAEGHTPRPLQAKATKWSCAQSSHQTRAKPWAKIPEPETYAMLLAGLALVGAVARRRKVAA